MSDLLGKAIGSYVADALLGTGSVSQVYRGVQAQTRQAVAIKVLHAYLSDMPGFAERFDREAKTAASLKHRNIVEVLEYGRQDGRCYIAMELLPDGSLRGLLQQRADPGHEWTLPLGVALVYQVAAGLAYAHDRGVFHQDLKPDNVLLKRQGQPGNA